MAVDIKPVPNAGTVLAKASSLWVAYGVFITDVTIKILGYLQDNREVKWQDAMLPIAMIVLTAARVTKQESITKAEKSNG